MLNVRVDDGIEVSIDGSMEEVKKNIVEAFVAAFNTYSKFVSKKLQKIELEDMISRAYKISLKVMEDEELSGKGFLATYSCNEGDKFVFKTKKIMETCELSFRNAYLEKDDSEGEEGTTYYSLYNSDGDILIDNEGDVLSVHKINAEEGYVEFINDSGTLVKFFIYELDILTNAGFLVAK